MPESIKLPTVHTPPAPLGVKWIDVETAAARMRVSERRIRQLCGQRWLAAGLARTEVAFGRAAWLIREDADAALSRVKFADQLEYDCRELTGQQRDALNERLAILKGWERHVAEKTRAGQSKGEATEEYLAIVHHTRKLHALNHLKLSASTLYEWDEKFRNGGLASLVDGRWQSRRAKLADDPFLDWLAEEYLNIKRPSIAACHKRATHVANEHGWPTHSYHASRRHLKAIPMVTVKLRRFGKEAYTNDCEPYHERDYSGVASNEIWCGDHHRFDVWVSCGGRLVRPWLTAWEDMHSRKIVGYIIIAGDPNQQSILEAFRRGIMDCGVPGKLYIDNGKDYDSYVFHGETKKQRRERRRVGEFDHAAAQGIFARLGCGVIHCTPYHGQSKPIERFFGTLADQFSRTFQTYCGNSPANRPENLPDKLARGKAPTLADFIAAFGEWLKADYHQRPHAGDGMDGQCPDVVFAKNLHQKVTAPQATLDTLLTPRTKPVTVTQNGVLHNSIRYGQHALELIPWMGKKVVLAVDGRNLSKVEIFSENGVWICAAESNRRIPANANHEDLSAAQKEKKRHAKLQKQYYEGRPRMHQDTTDLMLDAAAARNAANPPPEPIDPPTLVPLRTAIDEQMPAIERARAFLKGSERRATGTDGMSQSDALDLLAKRFREDEARKTDAPVENLLERLYERNPWPDQSDPMGDFVKHGGFQYHSDFAPDEEIPTLPGLKNYCDFRAKQQPEADDE